MGLRPLYHQTPERSAGHLFITVLAYQFVQIIRRHLRAQGITASRPSLCETLARQRRITATFQCEDRQTLHVRKATQPVSQDNQLMGLSEDSILVVFCSPPNTTRPFLSRNGNSVSEKAAHR